MSAGRCALTLSAVFLIITEHAFAQVIPRSWSQEHKATHSHVQRGLTLSPEAVAALVGIIAMLCISILCFAGWRFWVWRKHVNLKRNARRRLSQPFDVMDITRPTSAPTVWTRDSFPGSLTTVCSTSAETITSRSLTPDTNCSAIPSIGVTPPPDYVEYPTSALKVRIASKTPSAVGGAFLTDTPHLVVVESAFKATLQDELKIWEGETLHLLHEYEDGWCHVKRIGAQDAEQGVVPRICIVDKPDVVTLK